MQLLRRKQSDAYGGAVRGNGGASLGTCGWVAQQSVKLCADAEELCDRNVPKQGPDADGEATREQPQQDDSGC